MNWKSIAKQVAIVLVIVAGAAFLARSTTAGQKVFGTTKSA